MLRSEAEAMGHDAAAVDAKAARMSTDTTAPGLGLDGAAVLERCVSYYRGLHVTAALESMGVSVTNRFEVAERCGNKMFMTLRLNRRGVPTPRTHFAFSRDAAMEAAEGGDPGYPLVVKPVVGSWGRGVIPVGDRDTMDAILEMRELSDTPLDRIYYLQEMVERPPRDIRVITVGGRAIAAMYRESPDGGFKTNVALGAEPSPCRITGEIEDLAGKASEAVGGGILGVDMMEDRAGGGRLVVHEVNNTVEFRGLSSVTSRNIPREMVEFAASEAAA